MKAIVCYCLIALIGAIGLLFCLAWTIQGEDDPLQWVLALLSMLLILIAVICIRESKERRKQ